MRKLLTPVLAVPVVALVYLSVAIHRSVRPRVALVLLAAGALVAGTLSLRTPSGITAVPPPTNAPALEPAAATRILRSSIATPC